MATTKIHDLLSELLSFVEVNKEDLQKAKESDITDKNHLEFKRYVKSWCAGNYDDDPDILRDHLISILNE